VLRERSVGESLWESVLPAELRELPPELGKVDAILDEPLLGAVPRAADGAEWAADDPDRDYLRPHPTPRRAPPLPRLPRG
jgi:hypothetical protein